MINELTEMIELPSELIFSELQTKIAEKVDKFELTNTGYKEYYKRFQRAMRLSYTFFYKIKQIINLQYAGKKVSPKFWPNLKKVEVSLAADTMRYKTLDLKSLLVRGFTGQNGPDIIPRYNIN